MKPVFLSLKPLFVGLLVCFAVLSLNCAQAVPVGTQIYPKISNAKDFEIVGGSGVVATWPAPKESTFKLWVQIPIGSNAHQVAYFVYPKGNAIGSNACDSSSLDFPCYEISVDQSSAINGWAQLKVNNRAGTTFAFTKAGFVKVSADSVSNTELVGIAKVTYQNMTQSIPLTIGQSYQGGKIAYLDSTLQHGLIAAENDQSRGMPLYDGNYKPTGATSIYIGTGKANTRNIVNANGAGSYPAKLCDDLVLNGYSNWYLPSIGELYQLYLNKLAVGGFAFSNYWSSSEASDYGYMTNFLNFNGGYANSNLYYKDFMFHVRCIHSF